MSRIRALIASASAGIMIATFSASLAHADPDKVAEAKAKLDAIAQQVSAIDQEIIEASARVEEAEAKLELLTGDLRGQESLVADLSTQLGEIALVQMQMSGFDIAAQLFASQDEGDFLSSLATIHNETERSVAGLQNLQVGQAQLTALHDEAEETEQQLARDRDAKISLAEDYKDKEAEAQALYDRLNAEEQERLARLEEERLARLEQERLAAAQEAARAQAREEQERAAQHRDAEGGGDTSSLDEAEDTGDAEESRATDNDPAPATQETPKAKDPKKAKKKTEESAPSSSGSASDRAAQAVSIALDQVGKSYVWGTTGPRTFDCSGLMVYSYGEVDVSLTRTSRSQSQSGTSVSKGDLKPGDLVFYYSPVSHVGMYIGDGKIVHAANPRTGVVVAKLDAMPYSGARRVA